MAETGQLRAPTALPGLGPVALWRIAIITGVLDAQAGLVHRVWHRFAVGLSGPPRLILTGGNAQVLLARLSIEGARIEDNLVLRGLALRLLPNPPDGSRSR